MAAERRAMTWHWRTRDGADVEAIVTVDGRTRLVARPHQFSAVWTIYDGVHEWEELQFCLRYLRPGDHFVDVGANVGVFSTLVGTRILSGVRITAVEPFPPVRADLLANLALNDLTVEVVDAAVSDGPPGQATFEVLGRDVLNRLAPARRGRGREGPDHRAGDDAGRVGRCGPTGAHQDRRRGLGAARHAGGAATAVRSGERPGAALRARRPLAPASGSRRPRCGPS